MKKFLTALATLVLIAVISLAVNRFMKSRSKEVRPGSGGAQAVAVECAPVVRGSIAESRHFTGTLRPEQQFDIAPKISGRLLELPVELGGSIRSKQLLARLDDDEYRVALREREAEFEVGRAQLVAKEARIGLLKSEFERSQHLLDRKMASEAEFQQAQLNLATGSAEVEVAAAQLRQKAAAVEAARVKLGYCTLSAPETLDDASFYVGERFVDPGTLLKVNEPIVRLVSIDRLKAQIYVIERDYERLKPGLTATLTTDAIPNTAFPCTVARIAPVVAEASRQALVELAVPNVDFRLKPGMFIRVELKFDEKSDVTVVPIDAVCERDGKSGVFRIDPAGDRASFVPIRIGLRDPARSEVLEPAGLTGEVVILGHHLLSAKGGAVLRAGAKGEPGPAKGEVGGARPAGRTGKGGRT